LIHFYKRKANIFSCKMSEAWVTLVTSDSYSCGALTLAASLRRVGTVKALAVMVTSAISPEVRQALEQAFNHVVTVEELDSRDLANLTLLDRMELGITFTKIRCWTLTQFNKCVFLDADSLVLQNCDELFDREELSAAPDAGWPDCFNSGVFVFRPNLNTYSELLAHAASEGSFDGGDQGLLNTFFKSWASKDIGKHLPFIYNMTASATYSYLPAFKKFGQTVKIIHFAGATKPWQVPFSSSGEAVLGGAEAHTSSYVRLWWQLYTTEVKPLMVKTCPPSAPFLPSSPPSAVQYSSQPPPPPKDTKESWEAGKPDYSGTAKFSNIINKIDSTLKTTEEESS